MRHGMQAMLLVGCLLGVVVGIPSAVAQAPGSEEFGLTPKELVQAVEKVEALIARCMRAQGFQYFAADYATVRRGMSADKNLPGVSEEEFVARFGFGVATMYTGEAPQLVQSYSPARVGLGEQNNVIFRGLSPADRAAYNRALFGENADASFAVALETEDFSRTGGCTRQAIAHEFRPEQLEAGYYNPRDALINKHPKMTEALREYAAKMRDAGYEYTHPDQVEADIRARLDALTLGGKIPVHQMSPGQLQTLEDLRNFERGVAVKTYLLESLLIDPVEARIEAELLSSGALQ